MTNYRYKLTRRSIAWLSIVLLVAFMLHLQNSRYDNIPNKGLDYHVIDHELNCQLGKLCRLNKSLHKIDLDIMYVSRQSPGKRHTWLNLINPHAIERAFLRVEDMPAKLSTPTSPDIKDRRTSVRGDPLTKLKDNIWRSKIISLSPKVKKLKAVLYLFTADSIYEIRHTLHYP